MSRFFSRENAAHVAKIAYNYGVPEIVGLIGLIVGATMAGYGKNNMIDYSHGCMGQAGAKDSGPAFLGCDSSTTYSNATGSHFSCESICDNNQPGINAYYVGIAGAIVSAIIILATLYNRCNAQESADRNYVNALDAANRPRIPGGGISRPTDVELRLAGMGAGQAKGSDLTAQPKPGEIELEVVTHQPPQLGM